MSRKLLAAAFYAHGDLETPAEGPIPWVDTSVERLDDHTCATVWFRQNDFLDLREQEPSTRLADDPALPFAYFFREAAAKAGCEVAFLATRLHQADPDWLAGRYWMVQARDADSLVAETFGLLRLDDGMVLDWEAPRLNERNILPGGPGLTIFAGAGSARWF
ncbi:hypothetical protein ABZX92_05620 [Lentzea sp. NPDC006480]|uniref:hypothetical protein n=1 Tax=Lentzea sp. NPDC006480 TaxID=3157176 RepID=UPI0033A52598